MVQFRFLHIIICILSVFASFASAQNFTPKSRTELGFLIGGSHYFGDLNQEKHLRATSPAGQILMRYNIHSRLAWRTNIGIGKVFGDDSKSSDPLLINRNLSFNSIIIEAATGVEFHYLKFQIGHKKYNFTHYILAQLGIFYMNPKAMLNGEEYVLRDMGTEGQGTALNSQKRYSLIQLGVPLGIGFKFSPTPRITIGLEYGIRKTFTDYIDDVKVNTYLSNARMIEANGEAAAQLANRSLDQNEFGVRGNSNTKDWYSFFGLTATIQIGKHNTCVQP